MINTYARMKGIALWQCWSPFTYFRRSFNY